MQIRLSIYMWSLPRDEKKRTYYSNVIKPDKFTGARAITLWACFGSVASRIFYYYIIIIKINFFISKLWDEQKLEARNLTNIKILAVTMRRYGQSLSCCI
ncbi:hypothetical protein ACJX0J_032253 [Zea mays]